MDRKRVVAALVIAQLGCCLVAAAPGNEGFANSAGAMFAGGSSAASEGDCKYVYDAGEKVFDVDHHVYTTQTGKYIAGGQAADR